MLFLTRRDDTPATAQWWADVGRDPHAAPGIVRELLGGPSVAGDPAEVAQAVAWARAHPRWSDADPALIGRDGAARSG